MQTKERKEQVREALSRVRYGHFRLKGSGAISIACTTMPVGAETGLFYGLAFCAPQDNFSYAVGREIAERRLTGALYRRMLVPDQDLRQATRRGVRVVSSPDATTDLLSIVVLHLIRIASTPGMLREIPWLEPWLRGMTVAECVDKISNMRKRKPRRRKEGIGDGALDTQEDNC